MAKAAGKRPQELERTDTLPLCLLSSTVLVSISRHRVRPDIGTGPLPPLPPQPRQVLPFRSPHSLVLHHEQGETPLS